MRAVFIVFLFVIASFMRPAFGATDSDASCRPYFGSACSEALGHWLPHIPNDQFALGHATTVVDEIVDPAGRGEIHFRGQRGVYRGTFFVYGTAGPPRGSAVYDPVRRIAFYDEGCCAWHHVVVASNVPSPPKPIVMRSLAGVRTKRGIRLGDPRSAVLAVYGPALTHTVSGQPAQEIFSYSRVEKNPPPNSPCEASMTFLFTRNRLTAMDFTKAC